MGYVVKASNVSISYGPAKVIDSASFSIEDGDFVCIVGANGSGKTTLVRSLLGLIKPISGKITFGPGITKQSIGFLPQDAISDFNFPATVFEVVMSGNLGHLGIKPFYQKPDKARALTALNQLGIAKLRTASFSQLSGGQKQKVLLARALTATSKILILDEPSNNLDYKSRQEFYHTLQELNSTGLTIIMITHDLDTKDLIGNKIISISNTKVECTTTDNFLARFK